MAQKIVKALILGLVFGGLGYLIFKDISAACMCGFVMIMSMFIKNKN